MHKTGTLHRNIGLLSSTFAMYFINISYSVSPAVVRVSSHTKQTQITSVSLLLTGVGYCNAMLGTFPQKKWNALDLKTHSNMTTHRSDNWLKIRYQSAPV